MGWAGEMIASSVERGAFAPGRGRVYGGHQALATAPAKVAAGFAQIRTFKLVDIYRFLNVIDLGSSDNSPRSGANGWVITEL
jgi:hypothetical protein